MIRFLTLRLLAFAGSVCVMGFVPFAGALHPNPLVNHMIGGSAYTLAAAGGFGFLHVMWYAPWQAFRFGLELCPRRASVKLDKGGALHQILIVLAVVGACAVLFVVLRGLYRLVCEARHELVGAVRGANAQARRGVVEEHVVLDFEETS
jgi:hypothetical protein